jgi:hypothetical protein
MVLEGLQIGQDSVQWWVLSDTQNPKDLQRRQHKQNYDNYSNNSLEAFTLWSVSIIPC